MDGEGDAAALEHADEEAEAEVEEGEDVAMGHQQRHHHRMRAQYHPPPHGEGEHKNQTQTNNTITVTCATRVAMMSRYGTLAPELWEALLKTQQQLAMFTRQPIGTTPTAAPTWPHVLAKPPLTYIPPT